VGLPLRKPKSTAGSLLSKRSESDSEAGFNAAARHFQQNFGHGGNFFLKFLPLSSPEPIFVNLYGTSHRFVALLVWSRVASQKFVTIAQLRLRDPQNHFQAGRLRALTSEISAILECPACHVVYLIDASNPMTRQ
jgi:hypothetical protein